MGCLIVFTPMALHDNPMSTTTYSSPSTGKFPHTRAQLSAIARQFKPQDIYDTEPEPGYDRVSQSFLNQVVSLLVDENEDELKIILKTTFAMDDDNVSACYFLG